MKKLVPMITIAILGLAAFTASPAKAWNDWAPPGCNKSEAAPAPQPPCGCCHRRYHRHVVHRPAPPPPPVKVEETPVKHVTKIEEVVVVHHKIVELPPEVVHVQPRCCAPAMPVAQPRCCPPNHRIPGLPLCRSGAGGGAEAQSWTPTVDCTAMGGKRTINPSTGAPSCLVPNSNRVVQNGPD